MMKWFKFLSLNILILIFFGPLHAASPSQVKNLLADIKDLSPSQKIEKSSAFFLGSKTTIGPLGEGNKGKFDRDPLYSFEVFDCTTYVETVMALTLAVDLDYFKRKMKDIRYRDGIISYARRNHFISLDWIPNNSSILKDITGQLGDVSVAKALIDKKNWYKKKGPSDIRGRNDLIKWQLKELLEDFKNQGENLLPQMAILPYLSLKNLFINPVIFESIPQGSIISIVRPNWDLRDSIGTSLNISHQGIAIWKMGKLYYRHASSFPNKIVKDTLFKKYFFKYLNSETLKGINIQKLY